MKNISENSDYNEKLNSAEDVFLLCARIVIRLISLCIFRHSMFRPMGKSKQRISVDE